MLLRKCRRNLRPGRWRGSLKGWGLVPVRKPYSDQAAIILKMSITGELKAFASPLTFSNCYYILRKLASHEKVIDKLTKLFRIIDITRMSKKTVDLALNSDYKDFEDALQNYSAVHIEKLDAIITRNIKDFKNSELAVFSPEMFIKLSTKD